jgi:hypothetical protein
MSYTEFLRSKKAAAINVINTKKPQDASDITTQTRLGASRVFALNNAQTKGVISHPIDFSLEPTRQTQSFYKNGGSGRKPGNASDFTAYVGGQAIGNDVQSGLPAARVTQTPAFSLTSADVPQSASDFVRQYEGCKKAFGQPHNANTVTPPVFVDDTIRNLVRDPIVCIPHNVNQAGCNNFRGANHGVKAETAFPLFPNRPSQGGGQNAIQGNLEPGKEAGAYGGVTIAHVKSNIPVQSIRTTSGVNSNYKVGAATPHIRTVPDHHGNDLGVNPQRVPTPYVNVARQPPQKKANLPVTSI